MRDIETIYKEFQILEKYMNPYDPDTSLRIPFGGDHNGLQCTVAIFNVNEMIKEDLEVFLQNGWKKLPEEDGYCRGLYIQYVWQEEE